MSAKENNDPTLDDDAFGHGDTYHASTSRAQGQYDEMEQPDQALAPVDEEEEYEEEADLDDQQSEEPTRGASAGKRLQKRERIFFALFLGLFALLGIIGFMWKLSLSANGFKAPVPAEPIDVAEKESNRKNQPTDYADEEQMRTMNYDDVNSIYGLALKKQRANQQQAPADSLNQSPTVKQELDRSRQLATQRSGRHPSNRGTAPPRDLSYLANAYPASRGSSPAYGDPYHANPTREDRLLQSGFNTVKAERGAHEDNDGRLLGGPQPVLSQNPVEPDENEPIPGVVSGDQTIMNGTRVMFRTLADAQINDRFAPKGSILVGFAQLGGSRAVFNITTLRLSTGEAVPVRLRALDPDLNEGLAVQSEKPTRQQLDQVTGNAISQAAGQAAWSAGYSLNQATRVPMAGNALASLGAGLASAATNGRRREARQKLTLQDGFKVFFIPVK